VKLTYGRYELRARIDIRSGSWPAWWLWSRSDGAGWPKEGKIDMMEYYRGMCLFNIMDGAARWYRGNERKNVASLGGKRWSTEFHVWTMDWTAEAIDLSLDGTRMVHYRVADADGTGAGGTNPFRNPQGKKMIINQALGGSNGGTLRPADAPFELRVDWVRVHTWSDETVHTLTVNGARAAGPTWSARRRQSRPGCPRRATCSTGGSSVGRRPRLCRTSPARRRS
jgi:beta-glucanase (GH16 family)